MAIEKLRKRDGRLVEFDPEKIAGAINKAFVATYKPGHEDVARKLAGGPPATRTELEGFTGALYQAYAQGYGSRHSAVPRMKELWSFLICLFRDGERHGKAIRKAKSPAEYEDRAAAVFRELELLSDLQPDWTDMDWKGCCI